MKKDILKITAASVFSVAAYVALYFIWGAFLSEVQNAVIYYTILSICTSAAYSFILTLLTKYRKGAGEDEVLADYKNKKYISPIDDLKLVLKNEKIRIIIMGVIIVVCLLLNILDTIAFGKIVISGITVLFVPMLCFRAIFGFIGYFLSFAVITAFYIIFVIIYRRNKVKYWYETDNIK